MTDRIPVRLVAALALAAAVLSAPPADAKRRRAASPAPEAAAEPQVPDGQQLVTYDADGDQVPEVWAYYRIDEGAAKGGRAPGLLLRRDVDLNRDGRADVSVLYSDGVVVREELDLDFDGRIDQADHYEGGERVRSELFREDGGIRAVRVYDGQDLARIEVDADADGRPERVEYYRKGELLSVGHDEDGDGEADRWTPY